MSVIKQILNIVYNDGSIERCSNIAKTIEGNDRFWQQCGDNLVVKKIKRSDIGYRSPGYEAKRPGTDKETGYCIAWNQSYYYTDAKFVVQDGFGRIIHPDVLWDAYIAEFGETKDLGDRMWYNGRFVTWKYWGGSDRGRKKSCYARRNRNYIQNIKQFSQGQERIDDEPPVRKRAIIDDIQSTEMWWERRDRTCQKSWKTQSNRTRQFKNK